MWKPSKLVSLILTLLAGVGFVVSLFYCNFENVKNGANLLNELGTAVVFLIVGINFFYIYTRYLKKEGRI